MDLRLKHVLLAVAEHPQRDELLHSMAVRHLLREVAVLVEAVAGKPLQVVLMLCDEDTGECASASTMTTDDTVGMVVAWLEKQAGEP